MVTINPKDIGTVKLQGYLQSAVAPRPIAFASTVDKNGKVTKATVVDSNITIDVPYNNGLALDAARKCTFTSSNSTTPQTGTITIVLSVK